MSKRHLNLSPKHPSILRTKREKKSTPLNALAQAFFSGFLDSFVVIRVLSLVNRELLALASEHAISLDLHRVENTHALLSRCVLPRYRTSLVSLSLKWTQSTTDATIALIAVAAPELRRLNLHGCKNITNDAISIISSSLSCLTHLNLSFCSSLTDIGPLSKLTALIQLKLAMCTSLPSHSLNHVPSSVMELDVGCVPISCESQLLTRLTHIQSMDLSGCYIDASQVTSFTNIAKQLWYLSLAHCHPIDLTELWQLWQPMEGLSVLILRGLHGEKEVDHQKWALRLKAICPSLSFLDISCSNRSSEFKRAMNHVAPELVVDDGYADFPIMPCGCAEDAEDAPRNIERVLIVRPHALE